MTSPNEYLAARADDQDDSLPISGMVLVREVSQYGSTVLHPANKLAEALAAIAGTKTMTLLTIRHAKAMGLTVMTSGQWPRQL